MDLEVSNKTKKSTKIYYALNKAIFMKNKPINRPKLGHATPAS